MEAKYISDYYNERNFEPKELSESTHKALSDFLRYKGEEGPVGGLVTDSFTGEWLNLEDVWYSKDGFCWGTAEIYHFDKYNLPLKQEFIDYVLKQETTSSE